jgi:hypothetical protein
MILRELRSGPRLKHILPAPSTALRANGSIVRFDISCAAFPRYAGKSRTQLELKYGSAEDKKQPAAFVV